MTQEVVGPTPSSAVSIYTAHAKSMLSERGIDPAWVDRAIAQPDSVESDPIHPDRTRFFRAVPEREGRVLRVVAAKVDDETVIITVFFDRGRRRNR